MADEIPQWAMERAGELAGYPASVIHRMDTGLAFARYIAEHESPPVDPLLIEARELIVATLDPDSHPRCHCREKWRGGEFDYSHKMRATLAALRRGIELGKSQ